MGKSKFLVLQIKRPTKNEYNQAIERYSKIGFRERNEDGVNPDLERYLSFEGVYVSPFFDSEYIPEEFRVKRAIQEGELGDKNLRWEVEASILMPVDVSKLNFLNGYNCTEVKINRDLAEGIKTFRGENKVVLAHSPFNPKGLRQKIGIIFPPLLSDRERMTRDNPYKFCSSW